MRNRLFSTNCFCELLRIGKGGKHLVKWDTPGREETEHMKGTETFVHYGKGSETSLGVGVGYAAASVTAEGKVSKNASYSRVTMPRVKGSGDLTNRAQWTFEEDGGEAGQNGLESQYELSVLLSDTPIPMSEIRMTYWGQAVLWLPRAKETIMLGSHENPHERVLPIALD